MQPSFRQYDADATGQSVHATDNHEFLSI
jgi:hypothetical protein